MTSALFSVTNTAASNSGMDRADLRVRSDGSDSVALGTLQVTGTDSPLTFGTNTDANAGITATGMGTARVVTYAGTYGALVLQADGNWLYTLNDSAIGVLAGRMASEDFDIAISDGNNTVTHRISIGINQHPVLTYSNAMGDDMGAVGVGDSLTDTGSFLFQDLDTPNAEIGFTMRVASGDDAQALALGAETVTSTAGEIPADITGDYGTFSFSRDDMSGELTWVYTLDDDSASYQALRAGETAYDQLILSASDGVEDSNPLTATVAITGINDAPVIVNPMATVVFIDPGDGTDGDRMTVNFDSTDPDADEGEQEAYIHRYAVVASENVVINYTSGTVTTFSLYEDASHTQLLASVLLSHYSGTARITPVFAPPFADPTLSDAVPMRQAQFTIRSIDSAGLGNSNPEDGVVTVVLSTEPVPSLTASGEGRVGENITAETDTGITLTVAGFDEAQADDFTVLEAGATSTRFGVVNDGGTFNLVLLAGNPLDFEAAAAIDLEVTVTNTALISPAQAVTVTVADANDAPVVATPLEPLSYEQGSAEQSIDLTPIFSDEDGDALNYTVAIIDSDGGVITDGVALTGSILTIDPNSLAVGGYTVVVTADDGRGAMVNEQFAVTITPLIVPALGVDAGTPITLTPEQLGIDGVSGTGDLTFTIGSVTAGTLERAGGGGSATGSIGGANGASGASGGGAGGGASAALDSFTQADLDNGAVSLNPNGNGTFTVTITDSTGAVVGVRQVNFRIRQDGTIESHETGADYDGTGTTTPLRIKTGLGENSITTGSGDDVIDTGLADDTIDLSAGGRDVFNYRFAPTVSSGAGGDSSDGGASGTGDAGGASGGFVAWDGGDSITGFTPGEDSISFLSRGANADAADELAEFITGLGEAFIVKFDYALSDRGAGTVLEHYDVAGIEIHFPQAVLLPGGKLSGSIIAIEFAAAIQWSDFDSQYLGGAAFDEATLQLGANADGQNALQNLLGVEVAADMSRGLIIGADEGDSIDIGGSAASGSGGAVGGAGGAVGGASGAGGATGAASGSGGSTTGNFGSGSATSVTEPQVIFGAGGDDSITLDSGFENTAQEIVYRLADNGTVVTATDGSDSISNFALGTDSLRLVDTDGAAAELPELLGRFAEVSVSHDGIGFDGIAFTLANDTVLTLDFATVLSRTALQDAVGGITSDALNAAFDGGVVPSGAGDYDLSQAGLGYVDDLFGLDDGTDGLISTNTLPVELL